MSKTDDPKGCIDLLDDPEKIKKKIMAAVTDPGKTIKYDPFKKPGISNLLTIYHLFSEKPIKKLEKDFKNKGYAEFKKSLVRILVNSLEPFRRKKKEFDQREVYVKEVLDQGAKKAQALAALTMENVRKKMGLI